MPKSSSKSKATVRAARRARTLSSTPSDPVVRFYSGASGAFRLADQATASTALFPMVEDLTLSSNATGDTIAYLCPNLTASTKACVITAGNLAATWTGTAHPQLATLTASANRARMTGWRITVSYAGPEATAAGTMYVGTGNSVDINMVSTGLSNFTPQMRQYPLKAGSSFTFYAPMLGLPDFSIHSAAVWSYDYWAGMVFAFRGLPASVASLITIRSERSVEYLPEVSLNSLVSSEPEPFDPVQQAEAGLFSGTAQDVSNDQGPNWAQALGRSVYSLLRGTAIGAIEAGRNDVRNHLQRRMRIEL